MKTYIILAAAITLNATANILIKVGMLKTPKGASLLAMASKALVSPAMIMGIVCFGLALAAYSLVLSKLNLSIAYPIMTSLGFLIVVFASAVFLKETITPSQTAGFLLILGGVWLVAR